MTVTYSYHFIYFFTTFCFLWSFLNFITRCVADSHKLPALVSVSSFSSSSYMSFPRRLKRFGVSWKGFDTFCFTYLLLLCFDAATLAHEMLDSNWFSSKASKLSIFARVSWMSTWIYSFTAGLLATCNMCMSSNKSLCSPSNSTLFVDPLGIYLPHSHSNSSFMVQALLQNLLFTSDGYNNFTLDAVIQKLSTEIIQGLWHLMNSVLRFDYNFNCKMEHAFTMYLNTHWPTHKLNWVCQHLYKVFK